MYNKTSVVTQYHSMSNSGTSSNSEYVSKGHSSARRSKNSRASSSRISPSSKEIEKLGAADNAKQKVHLMHKDMQMVEDSIESLQIENAFLKKTIIGLRGAALGRYFTASDFFLKQLCMGEWKGLMLQVQKHREAEGAESLRTRDRSQCEQRIGNLETLLWSEKDDHKKTYQLCEDLQSRLDQAEGLIRAVTEQMSRHPLPHPQEVKVTSPFETTEYMKSRLHEILRDLDPQYIPPLSSPALTAVTTKERLERLPPYQSQSLTPSNPPHQVSPPYQSQPLTPSYPPLALMHAGPYNSFLPHTHRLGVNQAYPQGSLGRWSSNMSSSNKFYGSPSNCALSGPLIASPFPPGSIMLFTSNSVPPSLNQHTAPSMQHPHVQSSINLCSPGISTSTPVYSQVSTQQPPEHENAATATPAAPPSVAVGGDLMGTITRAETPGPYGYRETRIPVSKQPRLISTLET